MREIITLKLNINLKNLKAGSIIKVVAVDGIILDKYWRNRVKDSKIDNCVMLTAVNGVSIVCNKDIVKKSEKKTKKSEVK